MNRTFEDRVRSRLMKFARRNRFCLILAIPVLALFTFIFHVSHYCCDNVKRFTVMAMSVILFGVFSSFSFPMLVTGNGEYAALDYSGQNVFLAETSDLDISAIELLNEVSEEEYYDSIAPDDYSADEILALLEELEIKEDHPRDSVVIDNEKPALYNELPKDDDSDIDLSYLSFEEDDWRIMLINKQHSIPDDYEFPLGTIIGSMQCDERVIPDLKDMLSAAKKDGVSLEVRSPYRSSSQQIYLFDKKITKYMGMGMSYMEAYQLGGLAVTVPGASEHQVGLAFDIITPSYNKLDAGFEKTDAGQWLAKNSHKFGFILRYPAGKEYITCIEYEPWHFRYVGVEAATVIYENDWCLEEFWEEYF